MNPKLLFSPFIDKSSGGTGFVAGWFVSGETESDVCGSNCPLRSKSSKKAVLSSKFWSLIDALRPDVAALKESKEPTNVALLDDDASACDGGMFCLEEDVFPPVAFVFSSVGGAMLAKCVELNSNFTLRSLATRKPKENGMTNS